MKKQIFVIGVIVIFILGFSGCTETTDENEKEETENQLPIPVITIQNTYPLWWGDTLKVTAESSSDPDGEITDYVWWFDDGFGFSESKTGKSATFDLPYENINEWPPQAKISLAVTDDKGATAFSYNTTTLISYQPWIALQQVESTDILEVDYVIYNNLNFLDKPLQVEELDIYGSVDDSIIDYVQYTVTITDVDGNGYISEGDTFDISDILRDRFGDLSGSVVEFELRGRWAIHNTESLVGNITVTIE